MLLNYKYAFDKSNELINIEEVDKKNKGKYFCLDCGNELIARKGEIKVHHFSHKAQFNCNYESYLHKLAKVKFHKHYSHSLENNLPFRFQYLIKRTCNTCDDIIPLNRKCQLESTVETIDLTDIFDKVTIEKTHKGFIADVLLESTKRDQVIFIEFVVTHECEKEKIDSRIRIIEFNISCENDLDFIDQGIVSLDLANASRLNFKEIHDIKQYFELKECRKKISIFTVHSNGKAFITNLQRHQILQESESGDLIYFEVLKDCIDSDSYHWNFSPLVHNAYNQGIDVKNCHVCQYSTPFNEYEERSSSLFCNKYKDGISNSNDGSECWNFLKLSADKIWE